MGKVKIQIWISSTYVKLGVATHLESECYGGWRLEDLGDLLADSLTPCSVRNLDSKEYGGEWTLHVAKDNPENSDLLPSISRYWDYKGVTPYPVLGMEYKVSRTLSKHSIKWDKFLAP